MKILHSSDWHINLHKKKIPWVWAAERFRQFFYEINKLEQSHDIHIISGDVFDRTPFTDEICLFLRFINSVTIPTYIIPGNHEATKKGETFLEYFNEKMAITNPNVKIVTKNERVQFQGQQFYFFPYGEMQLNNMWEYEPGEVMVGHIRGEVPPHITEEYDFEKLRPWNLVLLGDIHFPHQYKDYPIWYSGSPMNTTFDRNDSKEYGVNSIDFNNDSEYKVTFLSLNLPKLIRKTLTAGQEMKHEDFNHVIYEITGSVNELAGVANSKLLDKKIATKVSEGSKLDLRNMSIIEELKAYLDHNKITNISEVIQVFQDLNIRE